MKGVAAAEGYAAASVARVSAAAGLSRATFYEHFANREQCFLACYRDAASAFAAALRGAAERGTAAELPWTVFEALIRQVEADSPAARLILLEALGGPPVARAEHERLVAGIEVVVGAVLRAQRGPSRLVIPPMALIGGVGGILATRVVLAGEALAPISEGLIAWAGSHALTAADVTFADEQWQQLGRRLPSAGEWIEAQPDPLLKSRFGPARDSASTPRERILTATSAATALHGYAALTVGDIVAAARVPRSAFYAEFCGKAAAFNAVQVASRQRSIAVAAAAFSLGENWPERVWLGLAALHAYFAVRPEEARLSMVEIYAAGESAVVCAEESRNAFTVFLEEGYRQRPGHRPPELCSETIAAAIYALMRSCVVQGRTARMFELLPQSAYVALAPFLGPAEALAFVELRTQADGRESGRDRPGPLALAGRG